MGQLAVSDTIPNAKGANVTFAPMTLSVRTSNFGDFAPISFNRCVLIL